MVSKTKSANGNYDLAEINTVKELREVIANLKLSIKKDEDELEERLRQLPRHVVKSAADTVIPSFLNKLIANGSLKLLLSGAALFANPLSKGAGVKKTIMYSAKKLGLITLVRTAYNYWSNKKAEKNKTDAGVKTPVVTTLNTGRSAKKN